MNGLTEKEYNEFMSTVKPGDWYVKEYIGMSDNSWGSEAVLHKGGNTIIRNGLVKTADFSVFYEGYKISIRYSLLKNIRKATDEEIIVFEGKKAFYDRIRSNNQSK